MAEILQSCRERRTNPEDQELARREERRPMEKIRGSMPDNAQVTSMKKTSADFPEKVASTSGKGEISTYRMP